MIELSIIALISYGLNKKYLSEIKSKILLNESRNNLEIKQKEILDSIHYAKRIQTALLANKTLVTKNLPNNFIYFQPKDIVSGDFYWATEHNNKFYLAVCDCTGHGVPGAFMSLLNIGFLSEAIKEKNIEEPGAIFNYVRLRLIESVSSDEQKEGMDGALMCFDNTTQHVTYAAAHNEPILISNDDINYLPKDKMPVGKGIREEGFKTYTLSYKKDDVLYLYTDGYADQFGGEKGKKFKYKQLNELLLNIHQNRLSNQAETLSNTINTWRGKLEQVDDILVIGIKL
jgi:serine phosphatase RsbU (regulator of sigma subunit)